MTYARSRPKDIVPYAEKRDIGLMTNAAHRWSSARKRFNDLWDYNTPHIVDSGGYNVQSEWGSYPWCVQEYHHFLQNYKNDIDWAAVMDYACEERFDDLHTVEERMNKTVENTLEHFNMDPEYNLLPVLQGRCVSDYVTSYERLKAHGIPMENVGLGTICRISSSKEILRTEREVREKCKDIKNIHGFGVKVNAYKQGASFESADSQAWVYPASNGKCYQYSSNGLETVEMPNDSRKRTVESFKSYYKYVTSLSPNFESNGDSSYNKLESETTPEGYCSNPQINHNGVCENCGNTFD